MAFQPESYGAIASLVDGPGIGELGPGAPNESVRLQLQRLTDRDMARSCQAGLWLAHNFLDESHAISQEIHSAEGSYWHAIMHRREPDFSNSKYWFRRVGDHPIFDDLAESARELASLEALDSHASFLAKQERWDPYRFVDLCEAALGGKTKNVELSRSIAAQEWRLLFDYCYRHA
jgi:hypothetical protein